MRNLLPRSLLGIFLWAQIALGAGALAGDAPERFASVYKISGVVRVGDAAGGAQRDLKQGDVLRVGDVVQASATGEAVLRTDDAGIIAVRPNASFVMERFSAKRRADDQFGMRLFAGALRLITGWTGLRNKENYRVNTPTATIGIRGTDHEPYVMIPELALKLQLQQVEGTYNKVNRGGTTLEAAGAQLSIDAGQVGFAPSKSGPKKRALMTALLPSLLEKVPAFYVPGRFDAELEALAAHDLAEALKTLAPGETPSPGLPPKAAPESKPETAPAAPPKPASSSSCDPGEIARTWLAELDGAITERQALRFVNLFAPQVKVTALVRDANGDYTELQYSRNELAKSTFASLNQLSQFASRRPTVNARLAPETPAAKCDRVEVDSVVIESGLRANLSYRLESFETFTLARQSGVWLAVSASTKQR